MRCVKNIQTKIEIACETIKMFEDVVKKCVIYIYMILDN